MEIDSGTSWVVVEEMSWILRRIRQKWAKGLKRESPPTMSGTICEPIGYSGDILKGTSAASAEHYRNISPFIFTSDTPGSGTTA